MSAHVSVPLYRRSVRQRYRVAAQKCPGCGSVTFPPKGVCGQCGSFGPFEEVSLSGAGRVYAHTVLSSAGAPPEFLEYAKNHPRYVVALVQLDEGPMIVGQVVDVDPASLCVGMRVETTFRRIYVEEDVIRYGYKFRPVDPSPAGA